MSLADNITPDSPGYDMALIRRREHEREMLRLPSISKESKDYLQRLGDGEPEENMRRKIEAELRKAVAAMRALKIKYKQEEVGHAWRVY